MLSSRPYLTRGLYEWLLDNEQTPYVVVDAEQPGVKVPRQFVQNGQIVLNVGPTAVRDLAIDNACLSFHASFGGQAMQVVVPMSALVAIYARETGVGMVFGHEPVMPQPEAGSAEEASSPEAQQPGENEGEHDTQYSRDDDDESPSPSRGRPSLRVVK
ncbi:ClpXP protease specificity-enhancing factor [Billgrantia gudaonensis]|uniref:Stringent starvation protein B n=1 Tax=Billgrantia gudaonensis TaxID=376427 RepID=A0A1G8XIV0_9GAMM|nr:ClpXP protease specificity-enhancing factor [Halomonas gudaonensis]SDJ90538.1 stringent starvation protein B [Halomonas gudaonensis]